ncbi:cAMP-regulated phosphoprotein 21 [Notolabrus celidotus]|uniref:cAMP-regulated phosphoprotein 21 n=1 Tax=Notolabrus celidotus TaxID=1203425 RepID=UPI00149043AF|nr:cAMP-regulated phosphoprotein 21 [Notolabrus celidotus]XP_034561386.1 cAMP-regulated phosphoprotein 21 [Notolabrus celidotus]XP_034561387.1 cAMP-regulated phosphoprotein 21 [Notolabrus celidotus]
MAEAVAQSTDVLLNPCDVTPCDVISDPLPPPCPSFCNQKEDEDCQHGSKEPEPQKLCNQVQPKKKAKAKRKLMRSVAVCEESSPFEETMTSPDINIVSSCHDNERTSCTEEEQEKSTDPKKHSLSKGSSVEYTDSTGVDLHQFIVDTLNSNARNHMMMLELEQDMIDFITSSSSVKKFRPMKSYQRMLVHRVAAYFGMEHNVDQTGKSVIINRTSSTRIPDQGFLDQVHKDKAEENHQWKIILKRNDSSEDQIRPHPLREKQSKSMEEREEEYQRVRDRIFHQGPPCTQESTHAETRAVEEYNPYAETQRKRQLFRGSRDSSGSSWTGSSRQSSTETDCRYGKDPPPWSSTDSDSSYQWRSPATKHHHAANPGRDTRGGSGSISLYRLPSICPHPSSPPSIDEQPAYMVENGIPPGSILVNPHTGQPFLNPDGTPAVYNPPDSQQPFRSRTQLQASAAPQQQQVVQYSSVSYLAPQMLPVSPSQPYSTVEDLTSQFIHMSCQSSGEAPPLYPPSQGYFYAAPPPPPPPPNPPSYGQPSPQVPLYYYSQYPTSAQHPCKAASPSQHFHSQTVQPTVGYSPAAGVQQSSHTQAQAVLGTYSPMASRQRSMVQGGVSVSYPQSEVMSAVGGEAGYCRVVPPPSYHGSCHPPSCTNLSGPAWNAQY